MDNFQETELVGKIIEELRPLLTNIVRNIMAGDQAVVAVIPPVATSDSALQECNSKISAEIASIESKVQQLLEQMQEFAHKEKQFNDLHEELQKYKNGLRRDIISPLLKSIIHQHGKITDQYRFYEAKLKDETTDKAALFPTLLKEYKNFAGNLEDLLYDYDVETVSPKAGEEFNPRLQKSVKSVFADSPDNERKIAECINVGFIDVSNERMLKQPEVAVYKLMDMNII
ncbi:MAG: nucleotide exchange factor GrpE [Dysgonamonadaceae bacterium]|jgi:molecular chaperone GrpE (heat shock protein)|nr:nucleotide exchange factor GrpE [Dysgonamonadaceae bacterium]